MTPRAKKPQSPIESYLEDLVAELRPFHEGKPYDFGTGPAGSLAISLCTVDGHTYNAGNIDEEFAIQSISKALTYGLALEDRGFAWVDKRIDVEPTGDSFNAMSLEPDSGKPSNALINAGAITATWCVMETPGNKRVDRIIDWYSQMAGRTLSCDKDVYAKEAEGGARNKAHGWMLASAGAIDDNPMEAVDDYLHGCAVSVTSQDLARMGAVLANRGFEPGPIDSPQLISPPVAERVMSVMSTCGMYDNAGDWMMRVGVPAKSGVGGGIMAVVPGELGIGVYSPPLDKHGNSVRGTMACERLSQDLDLHFARAVHSNRTTVRSVRKLSDDGMLVELQGDLTFVGIETALRAVIEAAKDHKVVVVDTQRVHEVAENAKPVLQQIHDYLMETEHELVVIGDMGALTPGDGPDAEHVHVATSTADAEKWVKDFAKGGGQKGS